jgi:hypothetical protein
MTMLTPWNEYNSHSEQRYAELVRGCRAWLARPDCNRIIVSTSPDILDAPIGWHLYKRLIADLGPSSTNRIIPGLKLPATVITTRRYWLQTIATIVYLRETGASEFLLEAEGLVRAWQERNIPAANLRAMLLDIAIYSRCSFSPSDCWWWPGVTGESPHAMLKSLDICSAVENTLRPTFIGARYYRPAAVNNGNSIAQATILDNVTLRPVIQNLYFNGVLGDGWPDDQLQTALGVAGNPAEVIIYPGSARFTSSAETIR